MFMLFKEIYFSHQLNSVEIVFTVPVCVMQKIKYNDGKVPLEQEMTKVNDLYNMCVKAKSS